MPVPTLTVMAARRLRRALTPPEARLWGALRRRAQNGVRFRRQHPIGPYVLDFYSAEGRLAVEIDGGVHDYPDQLRRDAVRDAWLAARRIRVLRIPAHEVRDNLDRVIALIELKVRG